MILKENQLDLSNFDPIVEKNLNDIDSDLDQLIEKYQEICKQKYLKKIVKYLDNHFETINVYGMMNFKILREIGFGGNSTVNIN